MTATDQAQLSLLPDPTLDPTGWCQRWRAQRVMRWQHPTWDGFDPACHRVVEVPESRARPFVERYHYTGSWPASRLAYGLVDRAPRLTDYPDPHPWELVPAGRLVGVAVLAVPMHPHVLTGPFPTLIPYVESLDLARVVLLDPVPANADSELLDEPRP